MPKVIKFSQLALVLAAMLISSACSGSNKQAQQSSKSPKPPAAKQATAKDNSPAVAHVNGTAITKNELRAYLRRRAGGQEQGVSDEDRQNLLNQLVSVELLSQRAKKQGLAQNADLAADLEVTKAGLMANAFIQHYLDQHPVSDKQIKAAYQARVQQMGKTEYKARHILLPNQAKAKAAIAKLEKGADFATLAKKESTGPSAKQGGELGWFNPSQMVPAFTQAVEHLKKNQYTHTPVKTRFGWHVIYLEDTRDTPQPSLKSMKDQLKTAVQRQQVEALVGKLRSSAKVNVDQAALKKISAGSGSSDSSATNGAGQAQAPAAGSTQPGQPSSSGG